jgi:hypothetical protein
VGVSPARAAVILAAGDYGGATMFVMAAVRRECDRARMEKHRRAEVPHPPFKWAAWMIAGAAAVSGLTWSDAPTILVKVLIVAGLSAAVIAGVYLWFRRSRK